ncbi:MAG TPA: hypothetical protein VLX92_29075 [Kofleriaceae bacterium]|nr:hypothetical protein [Kofleriaceae bacterium]
MKLAVAALAIVVACGDNRKPEPDGGPFVEAPHDPAPVALSLGGPIMTAPKVVPILFAGDSDGQAQLGQFLPALAASSYWPTVVGEYGVGALAIEPTIITTDSPPTTDDALATWIASQADGTHAGWPVPDANTIYTVFLPPGASLTFGTSASCVDFAGYHNEGAALQGGRLTYALLPRCGDGGSAIDTLTSALSHELVEASTDPLPFSDGAWQMVDNDHFIWTIEPGGELGDLCEFAAAAHVRLVDNFVVQRTWSNASAAAGHDPCVPLPSTPYVAAEPLLDETLTLDLTALGDGVVMTKGITVHGTGSKTIEVDLFSDAPAADFTVKATDGAALLGQPAELSFSWDTITGNNGSKLHLTVTRVMDGANGGSEFVVASHVSGESYALWWAAVAN